MAIDVGPIYERRTLRLRVTRAGEARIDTLFGKKHHVVPVVALVEGVVWPANVEKPEFVPAEVLAEHPLGWCGKPVTQSHPQENGDFVSANLPWVYEKYTYGLIFNAEYKDAKLIMEAWIDPDKVKPGSVAERSLETLLAGEMVEVSVGAFITRIDKEGVFNGQRYYSIWSDIIPDHLAILAEGEIGACSIEMGCGALRVAKAHTHTITDKGIEITEVEMAVAPTKLTKCAKHPDQEVKPDAACPSCLAENPPKKSWKERFQEMLAKFVGLQSAEDMTVSDLMDKLDRLLRATEPGYLGVVTAKPEAREVVYAVYPEERIIYYQRGYTVKDNGDLSLAEERVEVQRVEKFEPVTAATAAAPTAPQGGCGCHNKPAAAVQTETTGETAMNKDVLIHALVGSGKFTDSQRTYLATLDEKVLESLMAAPTPSQPSAPASTPAPTPAQPSAPSAPSAPSSTPAPGALSGASPQTMEQYIAAAPAHLQPSLRAAAASQLAKRTATIVSLKATGRCTFTDEQLATKTDQELEQLAALAAAPVAADFSGRGLPTGTTSDGDVPEPPSLVAAIQRNRGMKAAS